MTVPAIVEERIARVGAKVQNDYWPRLSTMPKAQALVVIAGALALLFLLGYIASVLLQRPMGAGEMTIMAGVITAFGVTAKLQGDKERETDYNYVRMKGEADALVAHYTAQEPPAEPPTIIVK